MSFAGSGQVENSGSGTIAALNDAVTLTIPTSSSAVLHVTGTWSATLIFEASVDGTNWFTVPATTFPTGPQVTTVTTNGAYLVACGGLSNVRLRASLYSSGTAAVAWTADNTPNISSTVQQGNAPWAVSMADTVPSSGTITALDIVTSSLVGANGQVFYFGTPTTNSSAVFGLSSIETVMVQANILGGGGTLVVEVSMDGGSFWLRPNVFQLSTQQYTNGFTLPFIGLVNVAGMNQIRVRSTSSWSGTATIIIRETVNSHAVTIADALPTGANVIGAVTQSGTWTVANVSTAANQTTEITALQILDDVPAAANVAFVKGNAAMGQLDDASTVVATEDNLMPVRITAQRAFHSNLRNVAGIEVGTVAAPFRVDPTGTTAQPVSDAGGSLTVDGTVKAQLQDNSGTAITLGQKTSANSVPVVLASDQAAFPVSSVPSDGTRTTYSATFTGLVIPALATDIFTISGSATKTVRILQIGISANAAADTKVNTLLIKRSAANTGGTSTTATIVPHDSASAAGTAVVRGYTVIPTLLGAAIGTIRSFKFDAIGTSTVVPMVQIFDFGVRPSQAVVLRGAAEFLAINLSATTVTTPSFNIWVEFTEE